MITRVFGKTGIELSAIGLGTNRFSHADLKDEAGLRRVANLVCAAIRNGVNYLDVAYTYSMFKAETIVRIALEMLSEDEKKGIHLSVKCMYGNGECYTADDVRNKVRQSLNNMGVKRVTFGFCWKVNSYAEFQEIIKPNGIYEGLISCKNDGLIDYICFSSHASPEETIRIIESRLFDGCIISCNYLNMESFSKVFEKAKEEKIGLFTMNSLAGGILPIQAGNITNNENERFTIIQNYLASLYDVDAITSMLVCVENLNQLEEDISVFESEETFMNVKRFAAPVLNSLSLCTKCRYCKQCPKGIPIADMMYAYSNSKYSELMKGYGAIPTSNDDSLKRRASIVFNPRFCDYNAIPITDSNPCIDCGICERICTQHLPIRERVEEMYKLAAKFNFSHEARKRRLSSIIHSDFTRVALFPAGKYTQYVIEAYKKYFGEPTFELRIFDNNPMLWGETLAGFSVCNPEAIEEYSPEIILITNFTFGNEIYETLINSIDFASRNKKIIKKLHIEGDIAWF